MTDLHSIRTANGHEVPNGTKVEVRLGKLPGHVHVLMQLPGQKRPIDLGDLPIVNGVVSLPLRLIFLCHATEDESIVESVADRLRQDGFLTWLAPKDLKGGDIWKNKIDDALDRADFVLVFLSKASSCKKGYFQHELRYAFEQRDLRPEGERYIIPVLLEAFDPPRRFGDIQWVRLWEPDGYERLMRSVA